MHVQLRRSVAATLLVAAAAIVPASCARDDSSIFIRGVLSPNRSDCTFQVSTNPVLNLEGTIDALYAPEYLATLLVENQLVPRGNANTLKTETSGVELYDAEVQVLDPAAGGGAIAQFSVPITGFIDPGQSGTAGAGASAVIMVDAATVKTLAGKVASTGKEQQVVSSVIIRGRTLGGLEVHTQEFLYPVTISVGGSCAEPTTGGCVSSMAGSATGDCRLGLDEQAGTNCQLIAVTVGICNKLNCLTPGIPGTAVCPGGPPNDSCCECGTSGQPACTAPKTCVNGSCM